MLACCLILSGCTSKTTFNANDNKMTKSLEKKLNKAREYSAKGEYEKSNKLYTDILKEVNSKDISLEKENIKKYEMYITNRAYLWIEKGYLTDVEIKDFGMKIDKAINDVEKYLKKDKKDIITYDGYEKMHFMITSENQVSNVKSGVSKIHLAWVKEKASPYVHEITHIVTGPSEYRWLSEGLAVLVDDLYNPWDNIPYYQFNGEMITKEYITFMEEDIEKTNILKEVFKEANSEKKKEIQETIAKIIKDIGTNSHTVTIETNSANKNIYYCFSGSYLKYLVDKLGIENVMKIYSSNEPEVTVKEISNKSFDVWREEWINYLKSTD